MIQFPALVRIAKCFDNLLRSRRQQICIAAGTLLIIAISLRLAPNSAPDSPGPRQPQALETFIPQGFTLVPIEVLNAQQLHSMIDDRAVVDLFIPNSAAAVAESVRLVRSPMDPNVFGVLVEESKTTPLLANGHEFIVVIKNRNSGLQKPVRKKKRIITYEEST